MVIRACNKAYCFLCSSCFHFSFYCFSLFWFELVSLLQRTRGKSFKLDAFSDWTLVQTAQWLCLLAVSTCLSETHHLTVFTPPTGGVTGLTSMDEAEGVSLFSYEQ